MVVTKEFAGYKSWKLLLIIDHFHVFFSSWLLESATPLVN